MERVWLLFNAKRAFFLSHIMSRISYISMKWWWWWWWWRCPFCTRLTCLVRFLSPSSLDNITQISSRSVFALITWCHVFSGEAANTDLIAIGLILLEIEPRTIAPPIIVWLDRVVRRIWKNRFMCEQHVWPLGLIMIQQVLTI